MRASVQTQAQNATKGLRVPTVAASLNVTFVSRCTEQHPALSKRLWKSLAQAYSYDPCTQRNDWMSIMSRGRQSLNDLRTAFAKFR